MRVEIRQIVLDAAGVALRIDGNEQRGNARNFVSSKMTFGSGCQALKQRYSSRWGNKRQSRKRLFSGLLKCGCCGGGMTISRGDRYYCSARREKTTCNADRGIGQPNALPWNKL